MGKKIASVALSFATAASFSGVLNLVPVANAQSAADLQAQIAQLLAQIQQLQAQLNTAQGGGSMMTSYNWTRDLTVGSTGDDVKALQQYLNSHGAQVAASGAGSPGNESSYFGSLTRAALAKWQAANGVSPAAGYFGPITRAKIAGTGPVVTPGPGPIVIPGGGLTVGLSAMNPPAGSMISSSGSAAARVPVLAVNLTAGTAGGVTVSDLNFTKVGVLSDTAISSAYLIENNKVLTQFSSLSGGVIKFSGLNLPVNAGQTRTVWLAIDPATGLSAGNTVSFALKAATDVKAWDYNNTAVTVGGAFPVNGNVFTVTSVSNPAIASLTVASSSVGTSVYAGSQNVLVSQWTLTAANSPVNLTSINFKVIGSANKSDIQNVKLFINGTQFGPTLASVAADGSAFFDLASNPARLNTGTSNLQVKADIMGSPSYDFKLAILNTYDVLAVDTQYNVPVSVTVNGGSGVVVTILQGSLTVTLASNTPTGNVAKGGSGTALAKFQIYAAGEPVKVKWLTFKLIPTGALGVDWDQEIKNVNLTDDAGNQVGANINSLATAPTCTDATGSAATSTAVNCFGSSSSPINYIVPANTTRVLTLRGDIQTTAAFTTIQAQLVASSNNNLQGQISSQAANSGAVTGAALTLSANALTVAQNSGVGAQTFAAGTQNATIGSYALTASSADGVNLTTITILTNASSTNFQNLRLMVDGAQYGVTQTTLSASASYTFSGNLSITAGQTKTVNVVADILSSAPGTTYGTVTTLSGCSGRGIMTNASVSCTSTAGQTLTISGQATVQVATDSATPQANQITMGTTGATLAAFRFTETSNVEDVKIDGQNALTITDTVTATSSVKAAFAVPMGLYLSDGTKIANSGGPASVTSAAWYWQFSFIQPLIVPKSGSVTVWLKGDVSSFQSQGASDNTSHTFKVATTAASTALDSNNEIVVALGRTSNATSAVSIPTTPAGNAMTILRSKPTVSAAPLGGASHSKGSVDDIGTITFAADPAGAVVLNTITIQFGGTAPSHPQFLDGVSLLYGLNGPNVTAQFSGVTVATSSQCTTTTTCTKSWNFGATTNGLTVSPGQSVLFQVRADSTKTASAASGVSQSLTATINANTSITFTDGTDSTATSSLNPASYLFPITVNSVAYPQGQ